MGWGSAEIVVMGLMEEVVVEVCGDGVGKCRDSGDEVVVEVVVMGGEV